MERQTRQRAVTERGRYGLYPPCDFGARGNRAVRDRHVEGRRDAGGCGHRAAPSGSRVYFKLGVDERFAKFSPGVQLTLELTRHLCADPAIALADSTANPDHPMINPIWRGRLAIGDVLIPLYRRDPALP